MPVFYATVMIETKTREDAANVLASRLLTDDDTIEIEHTTNIVGSIQTEQERDDQEERDRWEAKNLEAFQDLLTALGHIKAITEKEWSL